MAALRLFIKIAVPAVSVKRSKQGGLWLFSKRRIRASFSLRDKQKFPFGILWKTAKFAHSPKAGLWTNLSAAVYTQNPQPLLLITAIDNAKIFSSVAPAVSVGSVWGIRRVFLLKTTEQAKIPTVVAPVAETGGSLRCVSLFFLNCGRRAHLRVAPRQRIVKPRAICRVEGVLGVP